MESFVAKYLLYTIFGLLVLLGALYLVIAAAIRSQNREQLKAVRLLTMLQSKSLTKEQIREAVEESESTGSTEERLRYSR